MTACRAAEARIWQYRGGDPGIPMNRQRPLWLVLLVASLLVLLSRPAAGAGHAAASGAAAAASSSAASSAAASSTRGRHRAPRRHALLHPTHKYFGAFASGVPYTLKNLDTVATKVHKQPRIGGYFLDWTHEFNVAANQR